MLFVFRSVPDLEKEQLSQINNCGGTRAMTINARYQNIMFYKLY
jgi:hypothetical protein